jgi:hypothetical protein
MCEEVEIHRLKIPLESYEQKIAELYTRLLLIDEKLFPKEVIGALIPREVR